MTGAAVISGSTVGNHPQLTGDDKRRVNYGDKGLDQAIDNLSRVRKNAIPAASAMTINRVAITAINQSSSQVARETRVRRKLVKERSRLKRATVRNPNARIIVNRGDLPVIKLGIRMLGRRPNSILKAGQHRYQRAFIQRLNNGRWHVMQRLPQARYEEGNDDKGRKKRNRLPIQVVKIPMAAPLKQAFDENVDRIRRERLPKELAYALKQQLRIAIKR